MKLIKASFLALIILIIVSCTEHKKFDSKQWKNWVESENSPNLRWRMHKSLLEDFDLKSYSKKMIIDLLGTPDKEIGNECYYSLGSTESGIDTGTMIIKFEKDIVVNIDIIKG